MRERNSDSSPDSYREPRLRNIQLRFFVALFIGVMLTGISGCGEDYTPKPRGFQRISFPERSYTEYSSDCGFKMKIPTYATIRPDDHPTAEKCWFNVTYAPFDATLH